MKLFIALFLITMSIQSFCQDNYKICYISASDAKNLSEKDLINLVEKCPPGLPSGILKIGSNCFLHGFIAPNTNNVHIALSIDDKLVQQSVGSKIDDKVKERKIIFKTIKKKCFDDEET